MKEITEEQPSHGQNFEIPSFSHGIAVRTLRTTPLPPPLRKWSAIFGFALLVLEGGGANIETGQTVNNTATWNGAKLWENVLENVAERAFPNSSIPKRDIEMYNPWIRPGGDPKADKEPDIVISEDRFDIVIDAKYYDDLSSVMKGSSNYQMLGYALSALASKGKDGPKRVGPRTVAFAVPTRKAEGVDAVHANPRFGINATSIYNFRGKADVKPPALHGLEIEFPNVEVYNDENNWDDYFERVSKSFESCFKFYQNLGEFRKHMR